MKPSTIARLLAATALAGAGLCGHAAADALAGPPYSALYVFGDSLSDSGNNALTPGVGANPGQVITGNSYIPSQPYGQNAYTNQQTWVNSFAAGIGLASFAAPSLAGGGNYAYGGARAATEGDFFGFPPSAKTQLNAYLATPGALSPTALYVIEIGGNDVRAVGAAVAASPLQAGAIIAAATATFVADIGNMVDALQLRGAQNIVVWDTPNVGRAPAAVAQGLFASQLATSIASSFNAGLNTRLAGEAGVTVFDVFGLLSNVTVGGPEGFTNITDACGALGAACDPSKYLFWDGLHPTSGGHAALASAMLAAVAVPEPGSALLLVAGGACLLVLRRRRVAAVA